MNFLLHLRETARLCPNVLTAKLLRDAADDLQQALASLAEVPTVEAMQRVNASWVRAQKTLDTAPPLGGDGNSAGRMRAPEMRMAA